MDWVDELGWVSPLGTGALIALAGGAVALLLLMVIRFKVHAFIALIIVSLLTALIAGIPLQHLVDTLVESFGGTLGNVALLVALGAMIGALLESSGGARSLADRMIQIFGEKRAPFALGFAALFIGFPIFMDAALVLMIPVVYAVARRLTNNMLAFGIPVAAALSVMHVYLPPHPGPVAAVDFLQANLGYVLLLGVILALPTWYVSGYLWGMFMGKRIVLPVPTTFGVTEGDSPVKNPPRALTVILVLLLPVLLILLNTGLNTLGTQGVIDPEAPWVLALRTVGQTPVALLISLLVTAVVFGFRRGETGTAIEHTLDKALAPVCSIILITGAGGMFGGVLRVTGIGDAVADSLAAVGIPVIIAAYLIAAALRVAQGSATVALTTAAALIAPAVTVGNFSEIQVACIVLATAAGSVFAGHVNDSGFWLVGRLMGMDVKTTLKTWTVQQAFESVIAFAIVLGVYLVV